MPVKPVEKQPSKVDMKKAAGGQHSYAGWDSGAYDRDGFGLGQFIPPVSEDMPEPAPEPQKRAKRV